MESYPLLEKLKKIVDGKEFLVVYDDLRTWRLIDRMLKVWIFRSISDEMLEFVATTRTASKAWHSLQTHFIQNAINRECE